MIRSGFIIALLVAVISAGAFQYYSVASVCKVPLEYRIGQFDDGFSIDKDEAKLALMEAESVWEEATGQNLFTYSEDADFTVNFVFDERQAEANAEETFRERLDATENETETLNEQYTRLTEEYESLQEEYNRAVDSYEANLSAYNQVVAEYNAEGGAPSNVYAELQSDQRALERERQNLNQLARQLNQLVADINELGEEGNLLIGEYNENVERYNELFAGDSEAFTQGDYQGRAIHIYTFKDKNELVTVLAHEFGHALSLGHVEDDSSIMYYLMGGQSTPPKPTDEDLAAYETVCVEGRTLFGLFKI